MQEDTVQKTAKLKGHAFGMVGLLGVEFLLGMSTTLFVTFPHNVHGNTLWKFAGTQGFLTSHIAVGFLLLLGTIALFARAIKVKNRPWIVASSVALVSVVGAIITGSIFVPSQIDVYSYLMAFFFVTALLSYIWGIYKDK